MIKCISKYLDKCFYIAVVLFINAILLLKTSVCVVCYFASEKSFTCLNLFM